MELVPQVQPDVGRLHLPLKKPRSALPLRGVSFWSLYSPPDAIVRLHAFTDKIDDVYKPEELHQAIELYRRHKRDNGCAWLYLEVYEDVPACEADNMVIENCLLAAGDFPQ